jgi:L-asparaginase
VTRPFHISGAVPLDSFYVERELDELYRDALADMEAGPIHLHGSRQSGKSSLLIRARVALAASNAVAYVDLASLSAAPYQGETAFDQRLVAQVAADLGMVADEWHEHARRHGLAKGLADLCRRVGGEAILIFDELDCLSPEFRRRLCSGLRALRQQSARESELRVNVSLCGVAPPLGYFNGAPPREGLEPVGGRQLWLEDFPLDDVTAERWRVGFAGDEKVPVEAVRAMLKHGGGYPQACSWLGNLIDERGGSRELPFDHDFDQRLRELTRQFFDPAAQASWSERRRLDMDTQWARVNEGFFSEHGSLAREALDVYERVLEAFDGGNPVLYEHGDPRYELLRTSGLARLSGDGRIRLRCPLFADAFGKAWVDRLRRRLRARPYGRGGAAAIDKRLLIIGTGGTIGMAENPEGTVAPPSRRADWFRAVEDLVSTVEFEERFDLDSANVGPEHWTQIVRAIVRRQGEFDGIVVAHGTDTMAYTASAVAFALGRDLGFPVVFTGSQTTVDVPHGDAIANVLRAALVATQDLPEVVISFGEKVFRATRTQKKDDRRFDAFESPGYPELGFVAEEVQVFRQNLLPKSGVAPLTNVPAEFASGILHVSQMPGSEAAFYEEALAAHDENGPLCRGVIIQSLGAGNVPTESAAFDLTRLIREATGQDIPVVLTSQYPVLPANYLRYSPSQAAIEAGAIPTGNMTISAVVAKLSWVLPQVDREIRQGMLPAERRVVRVREMMGLEYVGEGGLTVVGAPEPETVHA